MASYEPEMTKLLLGDDIFDSNYWGADSGYDVSSMEFRTSTAAIEHLQFRNRSEELIPIWKSLSAFASKPEKYDGLFHIEAAMEISEQDPVAAFHLANNGSAFHRFTKGKKIKDFFQFVKDLAAKNNWEALSTIHDWMGHYL